MRSEIVKNRILREADRLYRKERRPDKALALCERIVSEDPSSESAQLLRLKCLNLIKPKTDVLAEMDAVLSILPESSEIRFVSGIILAEAGRPEEAEAAYRQSIELDPTQYRAMHNLGSIQYRLGRTEEGIRTLQEVVTVNPEYQIGYITLMDIYMKEGRHDEAVRAGDQASDLIAQNPGMAGRFAMALYKTGDYHRARIALSVYLDELREKAPLFRYIFPVRTYHDPGQFTEEEEYNAATYLMAVSGFSDDDEGRQGQISGTMIQQILTRKPDHAYAHAALSVRKIMDKDTAGAIASIDQALAIEPDNLRFQVAKTFFLAKEDPEQAMAMIAGVLHEHPAHQGALFGQILLLNQAGRRDEAIRNLRRLAKKHPELHEAFRDMITGEGKRREPTELRHISEVTGEDGIKRHVADK